MRQRMSDLTRDWQVGDRCRPYRGVEPTTVAAIEGDIVTLANGERLHITKMRSV